MSEKIQLGALTAILTCLLSFSAAEARAQTDGTAADATLAGNESQLPWPAQIATADGKFLVYQPQFEKWEGDRIDGRAAVSIQGQDGEVDGFGMVWLSACTSTDRTSTDQTGGTVTIRDISLSRAEFPTAEARSAEYLGTLRRQLAAKSWKVPLERLQADLQIERATRAASAQPLNNDAPEIIYSDRPAILVPVDGEPVLRDLAGTNLKRVINTRALMVHDDAAERFYLYLTDRWLSAKTLAGPWTDAAGPRDDLGEALRLAREEGEVDLLDDEDGAEAGRPAVVRVSTKPAELLQTDGAPDYAPVEGTRLLHVTNSPNSIFMDLRTQQHYALISGRWYRARSLRAPDWEYVSATVLPADFAMIPEDHATAGVRAAVPGTPQAREAAIANEVPQIAAVTRSQAGLEVSYDGDAAFDPIPGTSLYRAINAPIPVIRVADDSFYALDNGVWFVASSPYGPWAAATYVPPAVYAIPRSSPLHYVTYVRVYDATPEVVYVGYTPGYLGSYVSSDHVVVYGSGWHYRPWIGSAWYAAPVTWGFGFGFVSSWWYPWRPVISVGWGYPYYRPYYRPYWGPWHHRAGHHHHRHGSSVTVINNVNVGRRGYIHTNVSNIYGRWDRKTVASQRQSLRVADRRVPMHADRSRTNLRPGTGYIENAAGRRQFIDGRADRPRAERRRVEGAGIDRPGIDRPGIEGHRVDRVGAERRNDRRDWQNRDDDRRNRAALPPVRRTDQVRNDPARVNQFRNDRARNDLNRGDGSSVDPVRRADRAQDRADLPRIQAPHRAQDNAAPDRGERRQRAETRVPGQAPFNPQSPRVRNDGPGREQIQSRQLRAEQNRPRADSGNEIRRSPQAIQRQVERRAAPVQSPPVVRAPERQRAEVRPQTQRPEARPQMPRPQASAVERRPQIQNNAVRSPMPSPVRSQAQASEPRRQMHGGSVRSQAQARGGEGRVPRGGPAGMRIDR